LKIKFTLPCYQFINFLIKGLGKICVLLVPIFIIPYKFFITNNEYFPKEINCEISD